MNLSHVTKGVSAAGLIAASIAYACNEPHPNVPKTAAEKGESTPWLGPWISGSWYDPARSGEGFVLQFLPDGRAIAMWFTYPAAGEGGEQAWILAQEGVVEGNRLRFETVYRTFGGTFGDDFDPDQIERVRWGTLQFEFSDCNNATVVYQGPENHGSGQRSLARLSTVDELECGGARDLTSTGARALSGLKSRSGIWYSPDRSGEGWFIEDLNDGRSLVYWFTFSPQGQPVWTLGIGARSESGIAIAQNAITAGTRFGDDFDAGDIEQTLWGEMEMSFSDCDSATIEYDSTIAGYGSGQRQTARLIRLAGAPCIDGTPVPRLRGSWNEIATMPAPFQSEHGVTVLDDRIYMLGGFGDQRGFKRYDPAGNTWTELADMPAARNHLAAFAIDGGIYYVGGAGESTIAAYRYDVATNTWDERPELSFMYGSHAAMLNGRAYIGDLDGSLQEYDPRNRVVRRLPAMDGTRRDHSQVVAFLDEIWMIAGRSPETWKVSIYDPASERWRAGPQLAFPRGGFAAAVDGDQIVIGGGELLVDNLMELVPTVEVYTAGSDRWRSGPSLSMPVHGVAAGAIDGRVYLVGGSRLAGLATGATGRSFAITLVQ